MRAVLLDAGNTLLDADPPPERVYRDGFARYGLDRPLTDVHAAVHATWHEVARDRLAGRERWGADGAESGFWRRFVGTVLRRVGGGDLPETLLDELIVHFQDERNWRVYPDVVETLGALRARGVKLLVVSNWDSSLPGLLDRLDLTRHVDGVLVSALFGKSKPAPEIFAEALRRTDVAANEALHVGDSAEEDYHGAEGAGIPALLLDRHGRAPDGYRKIRSLAEIPDYLKG